MIIYQFYNRIESCSTAHYIPLKLREVYNLTQFLWPSGRAGFSVQRDNSAYCRDGFFPLAQAQEQHFLEDKQNLVILVRTSIIPNFSLTPKY